MPESSSDPHIAFTRHLVLAQPAFYGFLISLVQDTHAADDLLQDLATRLWTKFGEYDERRPFVAWGLGFARLMAMEWRRKQKRLPLPMDEATLSLLAEGAADQAMQCDDRLDALRGCLKNLTDHQRKALHQRYQQELPVAEMARIWGRTPMAVYKTISHAHRALFDCISETLTRPAI